MMIEFVNNRSFTLTTGGGRKSKLRRLKNGVHQGSVVSQLLFNIAHDLSLITSRSFVYVNDLALAHPTVEWISLKSTLNQDMATLSLYLQKWRLKLCKTKIVSTALYFNNRETKRELDAMVEGNCSLYNFTPTYLGVTLDRTLAYRRQLQTLPQQPTSRIVLIRGFAGTS